MYVISDYYKASRDVIAFIAGYYEKLFSAELLDQKISIQKWDVCHPRVVPKRLNPDMINMDVDYFVFLHYAHLFRELPIPLTSAISAFPGRR